MAADVNARLSFLDLSAEIRQKVYRHYLRSCKVLIHLISKPQVPYFKVAYVWRKADPVHARAILSLLQVHRVVRAESQLLVDDNVTWTVAGWLKEVPSDNEMMSVRIKLMKHLSFAGQKNLSHETNRYWLFLAKEVRRSQGRDFRFESLETTHDFRLSTSFKPVDIAICVRNLVRVADIFTFELSYRHLVEPDIIMRTIVEVRALDRAYVTPKDSSAVNTVAAIAMRAFMIQNGIFEADKVEVLPHGQWI